MDIALSVLIYCGAIVLLAIVYALVEVKNYIRSKQEHPQLTALDRVAAAFQRPVKTEKIPTVIERMEKQISDDEKMFRGEYVVTDKTGTDNG